MNETDVSVVTSSALYRLDLIAYDELRPTVLVERDATVLPGRGPMESVSTDHALGAAMAARHLESRCHRSVGLVLTRSSPTSRKIVTGWRQTCDELGLRSSADVVLPDRQSVPFSAAVDAVLDAAVADGVTGLLVHSDREAMAVVDLALNRGLAMPDDLSVVAYDGELDDHQTDRAASHHDNRATGPDLAEIDGVDGHAQRLEHRPVLDGQDIGEHVQQTDRPGDQIAQATRPTRRARRTAPSGTDAQVRGRTWRRRRTASPDRPRPLDQRAARLPRSRRTRDRASAGRPRRASRMCPSPNQCRSEPPMPTAPTLTSTSCSAGSGALSVCRRRSPAP